jgi:hypothetical protein
MHFLQLAIGTELQVAKARRELQKATEIYKRDHSCFRRKNTVFQMDSGFRLHFLVLLVPSSFQPRSMNPVAISQQATWIAKTNPLRSLEKRG